jgi:thiosulfate/3-mercaptopyruvate sulfurtransferase
MELEDSCVLLNFIYKAYGHPKVSVLDGGLPRWIKENYPVETGPPIEPKESEYDLAGFDESVAREKVVSYAHLVRNFKDTPDEQRMTVFDARPRGRQVHPLCHGLPFTVSLQQIGFSGMLTA